MNAEYEAGLRRGALQVRCEDAARAQAQAMRALQMERYELAQGWFVWADRHQARCSELLTELYGFAKH